mmetsp:Transcript_45640/g.105950  ORF Transcript_45640/g.105950 Transcript_45640/m.105950 type:complete len:214 (+) Transcript_45640:82-723(+)
MVVLGAILEPRRQQSKRPSSIAATTAIIGAVAGLWIAQCIGKEQPGSLGVELLDSSALSFVASSYPAAASERLLIARQAKGQSGGGPPKGKGKGATPFMAGVIDKKAQKAKKDAFLEPPDYHQGAPVMYQGKQVAALNGTMTEYSVDIWSGAHPIWQGKKGKVMLDTGSLTRFQEKFQSMSDIYGEQGLEQLRMNEKLKKEQEERRKAGIRSL